MRNLFAMDYPPDDLEHGTFSVGFHPYNIGKADEEDVLKKVRLATENLRVLAVGEIGLDKSLDIPMETQMRIFKAQVEIAELTDLPVILHVVRAFNEIIEFMNSHKPSVPMIIHGYNGGRQMAEDLVKAGFFLSFGEAITGEHSKIVEALLAVPTDHIFLETDEGDMDIREIYSMAAAIKGMSEEALREQVLENARTQISRFHENN